MADPSLPPRDWTLIAQWIRGEKERRARGTQRKTLEAYWAEIDRQVAMEPMPPKQQPNPKDVWLPDVELPLQFNALEVNCADSRRLKFPRGSEWYQVSGNITPEYEQRFQKRRETFPMVGGQPLPVKMNSDTASTLTKAVIDHYHRQYDFRSMVDLFDVECLKYGTGVLRVKEVATHKFFNDFRGTKADTVRGPACVPCSIKTIYLDDTPSSVMFEGITMSPGHIRCLTKNLWDVKNAIRTGGSERGWRLAALKKLEPDKGLDEKTMQVEFIEFEGDLVVPRGSGDPIFLPSVIVSIAAYKASAEVVRFQTNDYPFCSYTIGHYMRDTLDGPYGTSPLIKGQPIQEAATLALNAFLAAAAFEARKPVFYDRNDPGLTAKSGPDMYPGALNPVDSPEAVKFADSLDLSGLLQGYMGLLKQYEDLTAVNDPRRGGATKSHQTAAAVDIEQSRGLSRTDDFVQGQLQGPITSILYKEFEIIKRVLKTPQDIQVDNGGVEGWLKVAAADLPDNVAFQVHGAAGLLNDRQAFENFMAATNTSIQLAAAGAQMGAPVIPDILRIIQETYKRGGINNGGSLFSAPAPAPAVPGGAAGEPSLPPGAPGIPTNTLPGIQAVSGI